MLVVLIFVFSVGLSDVSFVIRNRDNIIIICERERYYLKRNKMYKIADVAGARYCILEKSSEVKDTRKVSLSRKNVQSMIVY